MRGAALSLLLPLLPQPGVVAIALEPEPSSLGIARAMFPCMSMTTSGPRALQVFSTPNATGVLGVDDLQIVTLSRGDTDSLQPRPPAGIGSTRFRHSLLSVSS